MICTTTWSLESVISASRDRRSCDKLIERHPVQHRSVYEGHKYLRYGTFFCRDLTTGEAMTNTAAFVHAIRDLDGPALLQMLPNLTTTSDVNDVCVIGWPAALARSIRPTCCARGTTPTSS